MNTVRGIVASVSDRGDGTDRVLVVLNSNTTARVTVPTGTIKTSQHIKLGFDPESRTYSYPAPA